MSKKVLLIGDVMLDINTHGTCTRISPEAPVQVVKKSNEVFTLGGAGNNLVNLYHLNVDTDFISVIGGDNNGNVIQDSIKQCTKRHLLIQEEGRVSTVKNRIIAHGHQVLRIDTEDTHPIQENTRLKILEHIKNNADSYEIILISDYNKGVCTEELIKDVVSIANKHNIKVICDPKKHNIQSYKGCYIVTPNKTEAEALYGSSISTNEDIQNALLFMKRYIANPIITLSEKGIAYLDDNGAIKISSAQARGVVDVTGAGDTVVSTICYCIMNGYNLDTTISMANKAAAIVVTKLGTAFVKESELFKDNTKVLASHNELPKTNGKVVFTNGCFDILHTGHVKYLNEAKKLGDILIVGVNSDNSVKRLKGSARPVNNLEARMSVLSGLSSVDYIIPFNEDTPYNLISAIKPNILVKGGDYNVCNIVGNDIAQETIVIPFVNGFSTTQIIEKMKK